MYPGCDIDRTQGRGETWPVDIELRGALDQLGTNLRGEVRSADAGLRKALNQVVVDLRGEIQASSAEMRRHFDMVAESLRSDIRAVAEGMVASRQQTDRRVVEPGVQTEGLGDRVLRLEVRVKSLEDGRKARQSRRGR